MFDQLTTLDVVFIAIGAFGIGFSKAGFHGISMLHVILYAIVFGSKQSTGTVLPMLVIGDVCAMFLFGQQAVWSHIRKLFPPAFVGVILGWLWMNRLDEQSFRMIVGGIILTLTIVQAARMRYGNWFDRMPHQAWFALLLGVLAGLATMLANAAGPVVALYLLAVTLPKWELIGTSAWFFLVLNVSKLPFSYNLGLIDSQSLAINLAFAPFIPLGIFSGRWLAGRISQAWFNAILLTLTALASLHLLGVF